MGDWVGLTAGLDVFGEEGNLVPLPGLESRTVQPVSWSLYRLPSGPSKQSSRSCESYDRTFVNVNL